MSGPRSHAPETPPTHPVPALSIPVGPTLRWIMVVVTTIIQIGSISHARAATVTVNSTADVVDFTGARQVRDLPGPDGRVTFAEAALATTNTPGPDLIAFCTRASRKAAA